MIKIFLLILMPIFILGLRVSDAWMSDIERLKPATSNRIETFVFPTKNMNQDFMQYPSHRGTTEEMSFEPLYFKFRHKLNGKVQKSIPIPAEAIRSKLPKFHPRGTEALPFAFCMDLFSGVTRRHGLLSKRNRSPPVIDRSLLPSHTMTMRYPPPGYTYPPPADPMQFGSPSSLSPVTSPMDGVYEDSIANDQEGEDDVIVIHEHHHHHHHNTDEEGSEHENQQDGDDTLPTTDELMDNIVNDKVLYDFVSFLLESQRPKETVPVIPVERYSELSPPLYREETERIVGADLDDIEHFLEDGFEPIIEVELE